MVLNVASISFGNPKGLVHARGQLDSSSLYRSGRRADAKSSVWMRGDHGKDNRMTIRASRLFAASHGYSNWRLDKIRGYTVCILLVTPGQPAESTVEADCDKDIRWEMEENSDLHRDDESVYLVNDHFGRTRF